MFQLKYRSGAHETRLAAMGSARVSLVEQRGLLRSRWVFREDEAICRSSASIGSEPDERYRLTAELAS
jgi:hypothetical protein